MQNFWRNWFFSFKFKMQIYKQNYFNHVTKQIYTKLSTNTFSTISKTALTCEKIPLSPLSWSILKNCTRNRSLMTTSSLVPGQHWECSSFPEWETLNSELSPVGLWCWPFLLPLQCHIFYSSYHQLNKVSIKKAVDRWDFAFHLALLLSLLKKRYLL